MALFDVLLLRCVRKECFFHCLTPFESMVRNDSTVLELVIRFALVPVDFRYQKIIASGFRPVEEGEGPLCRVSLLS
ncbi:hypothetical protein Bca4012_034173 [Brassica carinata]